MFWAKCWRPKGISQTHILCCSGAGVPVEETVNESTNSQPSLYVRAKWCEENTVWNDQGAAGTGPGAGQWSGVLGGVMLTYKGLGVECPPQRASEGQMPEAGASSLGRADRQQPQGQRIWGGFPRDGADLCLDARHRQTPFLPESSSYSLSPQGPSLPTLGHSLHTSRSSLPRPLPGPTSCPFWGQLEQTRPSFCLPACFPLLAVIWTE